MKRSMKYTPLIAFSPEQNSTETGYRKKYTINSIPNQVQDIGSSILSIAEIFKRMFADSRKLTLAEQLGFPDFPDAATLTEKETQESLNECLRLLKKHRIRLHFQREYPAGDLYKFITEELFAEEIDENHYPGSYLILNYEDYFNHEIKASTEAVSDLLQSLFSDDWRFINHCLSRELLVDGIAFNPYSGKEFRRILKNNYGNWRFNRAVLKPQRLSHSKVILNAEVSFIQVAPFRQKTLRNVGFVTELHQGQFLTKEIMGLIELPLYTKPYN